MCGHAGEQEGIAPHNKGETIETGIPYKIIKKIISAPTVPRPHHNETNEG